MNPALEALIAREQNTFIAARPQSIAFARLAGRHFAGSVPMHWMRDWPIPVPLYFQSARDAVVTDVDGHEYVDFCLGDTGAMFGHSPPAVAQAIAAQAALGLTAMLPGCAHGRGGRRPRGAVRPAVVADHADGHRCQSRRAALGPHDHRALPRAGVRSLLPRHRGRDDGGHGRGRSHAAASRARSGRVHDPRSHHGGGRVQRHRCRGARARAWRHRLRAGRTGDDQRRHGAAAARFPRRAARRLHPSRCAAGHR